MTILESLLYGAIQGATEFLPVSSSGHLTVLKGLLDQTDVPVLFDVLLHVATLVVVIGVFRERVIRILAALWRWVRRAATDEDAPFLRLAWVIVVATVLTGAIGIGIEQLELNLRPVLVSAMFIVTAAILILARFAKGERDYQTIGWREAIGVGFAQGFGVIPGISRSGITISAGRAAGLSREKAGEFAFLVSIPAILGALVLSLRDLGELRATVGVLQLVVGFLAALVVGWVALTVLLRLVRSGRLYWFAFYLVPLGIAGIILFSR